MYPFLRLAKELFVNRKATPLQPFDTHVSHHICWPWDLDFLGELNNGRTLTLYDLGRTVLAKRAGLIAMIRRENWGLTVAGSSLRYRKRVAVFDRLEMRSRLAGWDDRFVYVEQSMWRKGTCTSHGLLRVAVTDRNGMVPMETVTRAFGPTGPARPLPGWIAAWASADAQRPWPPMQDDTGAN
jgi:acyl-CoA thioesterase FadM